MIPARFQHLVFAFFMAFLMSGLMSLVITAFNVGLVSNLLTLWLQAWSFAFVVAFPSVVVVSPLVKKLTTILICDESNAG